MFIYAATALKPDRTPIVGFVRAANPDDALCKAAKGITDQFGNCGKVTHVVKLCRSSPASLKRNGLGKLLPYSDQIEIFVVENLVLLAQSMEKTINELRTMLAEAMERVKADELRPYRYIINPPTGEVIRCTCNARDIDHAREQAEFWAADFDPEAKVIGLQEDTK